MGKGIAEFFDTDPSNMIGISEPPIEACLKFYCQELAYQHGQHQCFNEKRIGSMIERMMQLIGLLHGPELDLDTPAHRIEFVDLNRIDVLSADVGDDETPAVLDEASLGGSRLMTFGIPAASPSILLGLLGRESSGDETAPMSPMPSQPDVHVQTLCSGLAQDVIQEDSLGVKAGQDCR